MEVVVVVVVVMLLGSVVVAVIVMIDSLWRRASYGDFKHREWMCSGFQDIYS